MLFCPKCGSILRLKEKSNKKILWCLCGFNIGLEEAKKIKKEKEKEREEENKELLVKKGREEKRKKEIEIVEDLETHPKINIRCPECNHSEAYYWTQQTRGADEAETRFFKCTKCSYTWREYS